MTDVRDAVLPVHPPGEPPLPGALAADALLAGRSRSSRRFAVLILAGAGTRIIALLSQIVIARLLGPGQTGSLAFALSLCMGLVVLSDAGLTALSIRRIVHHPQSRGEIVTATLVVQVVLTTALAVVLVALGLLLPWRGDIGVLLAISAPVLTCVAFNMLYVFIAAERVVAIAALRLLLAAAPAVVSVAAAFAYRDAAGVLVANIVGFVLYDAAVLFWARRSLHLRFVPRVARTVVVEMCRAGLPVMGSAVLLLVPTVAATIVAGAVLGPHPTGLFSAAWQFSFAAVGLWVLVVDVFYPVLVRQFAAAVADFRITLRALTVIGLRCSLPVCVFVSFAADPLVHLVYGSRFSASVAVLQILIWILPLAVTWTTLSQALLAVEAERRLLRLTARTNAALIALCVLGAAVGDGRGLAAGCLAGGVVQVLTYVSSPVVRAAGVLSAVAEQAAYGVVPAILCILLLRSGVIGTGVGPVLLCSLMGLAVAELLSKHKTTALMRATTSS